MTKRALIEKATNRVVQVEPIGNEFEIHEGGLFWTDCPDNVETFWLLLDDGTYEDPHAGKRDEFGNAIEPWIMQRMRGYAAASDQLDMLYRELKTTGTISTNGEWFQHITAVKAAIPKPQILPPESIPPK